MVDLEQYFDILPSCDLFLYSLSTADSMTVLQWEPEMEEIPLRFFLIEWLTSLRITLG
jgi:hypothetical protein